MADKAETLKAKKEDAEKDQPQIAENALSQAGANQSVEMARGSIFGDTTSSSSGANVPGLHGRDGGETNNPVAEDHVIDPSQEQAPADE